MRTFTFNLIAAVIGAAAGYAFHQRQHQGPPVPGVEPPQPVVAAPLANVGAATLAGLVLRSPVAALLAGFTISATMGTTLDQKLRELAG